MAQQVGIHFPTGAQCLPGQRSAHHHTTCLALDMQSITQSRILKSIRTERVKHQEWIGLKYISLLYIHIFTSRKCPNCTGNCRKDIVLHFSSYCLQKIPPQNPYSISQSKAEGVNSLPSDYEEDVLTI